MDMPEFVNIVMLAWRVAGPFILQKTKNLPAMPWKSH